MEIIAGKSTHPILLFDGTCNLCDGSVQWILRADRHKKFRFASLQSDFGQSQLQALAGELMDVDSVILLEGDRVFVRSAAVLRVFHHLGGGYGILALLGVIPRWLRDPVYDWIARKRYGWFGKRDRCLIPTPELRERFLD